MPICLGQTESSYWPLLASIAMKCGESQSEKEEKVFLVNFYNHAPQLRRVQENSKNCTVMLLVAHNTMGDHCVR